MINLLQKQMWVKFKKKNTQVDEKPSILQTYHD